MAKVLVVGDIHAPWENRRACEAAIDVANLHKPTHIILVGDQLDAYNWSKYSPSRDLMTPKQEVERGMRKVRALVASLRLAAGTKPETIVLKSNHQDRFLKRVREACPAIESLLDHGKLWIPDTRETDELDLDGVHYMHGFRAKGVDHARYNQMSTVHGHTHQASLVWLKNRRGPYFNMEVGWLGNEKAPVFEYKQQRLTTWNIALGLVTSGLPRLLGYRNATFG